MKRAMFIMAYDRTNYLIPTLDSLRRVRGFREWPLVVRIEPSPRQDEIIALFDELEHPDMTILVNPVVYGAQHHPWVGFEEAFKKYDFVLCLEDDHLVSDDLLEYFEWASVVYENHPRVATVLGYTHESGPEDGVLLEENFTAWVWGTWRSRWHQIIRDSWDHDYSTFNGHPGNQSGYDWNLNTRVFPEHGLLSVIPQASRVQNIGVWGVHGTPENFQTTSSFEEHREETEYVESLGR